MTGNTPDNFRLRFCKLVPLSDEITEIIADKGTEINLEDVNAFHNWLDNNHENDIALLVNKKNHCSYTFNAQREMGNLERIKAIAYVIYDNASEIALQSMLAMKSRRNIPHYISYDYDEALNWLKLQVDLG